MDPSLDPPPVPAQPTPDVPPAAEPVHPPYSEMIVAAVTALNESEGSSKRAISKYIEQNYTGLPPTHQGLLTQHLKHLKSTGQISMVKYSYKLSDGSALPAVNGAVSATPNSTGSKKRGRPSKPKPDAVQDSLPVFGDPVNGAGSGRGRGRPPKAAKGRGRPKKNSAAAAPPVASKGKGRGRSRGRPPKAVNIAEGTAPAPVATVPVGTPSTSGKRRGRPPKAGGGVAKKPMKRSGRSVGRPRKNSVGNQAPESQLLASYLGLKEKLDTLKEKVSETATVVKPFLVGNDAAINALYELEVMAANINAPAVVQQPPPPVQPQI